MSQQDIITPTVPAFCTLAQLKSSGALNSNWRSSNDSLAEYIGTATETIISQCNRDLIKNPDPSFLYVEMGETFYNRALDPMYQPRDVMKIMLKQAPVDLSTLDIRISYDDAWDDPTGLGYRKLRPAGTQDNGQWGPGAYITEQIGVATRVTIHWTTYKSPLGLRIRYNAGFSPVAVTDANFPGGDPDAPNNQVYAVPYNLRRACALQALFTANRFIESTEGVDRSGGAKYGRRYTAATQGGLLQEAWLLCRSYRRNLTMY